LTAALRDAVLIDVVLMDMVLIGMVRRFEAASKGAAPPEASAVGSTEGPAAAVNKWIGSF
jgi:hypothetical protein